MALLYQKFADDTLPISINLEELSLELTQLSRPHALRVYILILHHSFIHNSKEAIPYDGMILTKENGVSYSDLNKLPRELIEIIAKYLRHAKHNAKHSTTS